jgi:MFS family permease
LGTAFLDYLLPAQSQLFVIGCIIARLFQGGGDITIQTCMYSALTNTFFESKEVYLGYGEAAAGLGLMVGPIIGGALNDIFGYFVCYIAICLFICLDIVFTIIVMPADKNREKDNE